jgi:hypothetical protein
MIRLSFAVSIAAASATLAAVGGATAGGITPDQLRAAGWTCFLDPGAPRIVCSDPGHGRPVPGDPNAPPSYNFKLFTLDGSFIGTNTSFVLTFTGLSRARRQERPTSSSHSSSQRSVITAANTSKRMGR